VHQNCPALKDELEANRKEHTEKQSCSALLAMPVQRMASYINAVGSILGMLSIYGNN